MLYSGTDPESYVTENTLVYEGQVDSDVKLLRLAYTHIQEYLAHKKRHPPRTLP